ncbi:hypothetical protein [Streptomyces cinereoruber]|uniref:hypothetical protein n=1 Tax=Streptomyces cinereoruber TaxID=67260 RepID=UPI003C2C7B5E
MALAVPRTWVVGEVVAAATLNAEIRDQFNDLISGWTTYTPAWTASTAPSIGNGTLIGRYKTIGKLCTVQIEIVMGTTTTFGTGIWFFSLPFTAASPAGTSANWVYMGSSRAHSATTWYTGISAVVKGTSVLKGFSPADWSPTVPHSWVAASTNYGHLSVTYETV